MPQRKRDNSRTGGPYSGLGLSDAPEVDALADAWASIDGKLKQFRAGRGKPITSQPGGCYGGYMADTEEMLNRLWVRGFKVVKHRT